MLPELPFDLVGCKVKAITWPDRGVQMVLSGVTASGEQVEGAVLSFTSVANQHVLQQFLSHKRVLEEKGTHTNNRVKAYPLKLPALLSVLKPSRAKSPVYADKAFHDAHGKPPYNSDRDQLCLFALDEKRFANTKSFPIVYGHVTLGGVSGKTLSTPDATPSPVAFPEADMQQLGIAFMMALLEDRVNDAHQLLSRECQKRVSAAKLSKRFRDWVGYVKQFAEVESLSPKKAAVKLREHLSVDIESDPAIIWEAVQTMPAKFPREAAYASLDIGAEFFRESITVYVIDDDGQPKLSIS